MRKNHYSEEIKKETVEKILSKEKTQAEMSEALKVSKNTIWLWVRKYQAPPKPEAPSFATLEEISKLEAEVAKLKEEKETCMRAYLQKEATERRFHEFKLLLTSLLNLENGRG